MTPSEKRSERGSSEAAEHLLRRHVGRRASRVPASVSAARASDDESIGQGATMAKYVAEGRGVTLVTCTAGEMGEILVPELEHLAADRDGRGSASTAAASSPTR